MSISQIPSDGNVSPLKDQQLNQIVKQVKSEAGAEESSKTTGGDSVELSDQAKLFQEIEKYKKELETIPTPNEGRIKELQDSIANGTFITDKAISDTADRLLEQLLG